MKTETVGCQSAASMIDLKQKYLLLTVIMMIAIPVLCFFGLYALYHGDYRIARLDIGFGCLIFLNFLLLGKKKTDAVIQVSGKIMLVLFGAILLHHFSIGGESFSLTLWTYAYPLCTLFLLGNREGMVWISVFYLFISMMLFFPDVLIPAVSYPFIFRIRFMASSLLVTLLAFSFEFVRNLFQNKFMESNRISEETNRQLRQTISERQQAEEYLAHAYEELQQTQYQLIQSAKLASIGELSAGIAHELNQPLMVIRTTIQLINRYIAKGNTDIRNFSEQFEKVEKNTTRMMNIIDHLRTFARQSSMEYVLLDINRVAEEALTMLSEQLRLRSIIVEKQFSSDLPQIHGNPNQLEQVFLNLITNARDSIISKYSTDINHIGKLEISIRFSEKHEKCVEVLFRDNGCGIPEKLKDKIFDPFFTTKEVGRGTGLGLSISYGIIKEHRGSIDIAETSSAGTVFRIILPSDPAFTGEKRDERKNSDC